MKRLLIVPALLLVVVLGVPLALGNDPLAGYLPQRADERDVASAAHPSASPTRTPPHPHGKPARVHHVWHSGDMERGVHIYWEAKKGDTDTVVHAKARRLFQYVVRLNANAVALSFPFSTKSPRSTTVYQDPKITPSPHQVRIVLEEARRSRLRTTLRPLLDERSLNPPDGWRGNIHPTSRHDWFVSYRHLLAPYVDVAERYDAHTLVLGTELNSLERDPRWRPLVNWTKRRFSGEVAYAANWDNYTRKRIKVPSGRLGVDAYPPLRKPDDTPVSRLVKHWNHFLAKSRNGPLKNDVLYEAGIVAQHGAYRAPGDFYNRRRYDEQVQANWFTAVCHVVKQHHMRGVYWWALRFSTDPKEIKPKDDTRFGFANRPKTEHAIRSCFR